MTVKEIYLFLDEKFPFSSALDFDNVGLLIGNHNSEVKRALVSLDCSSRTVRKAIKMHAQLIITHHPVVFDGLKSIDSCGIYADLIKNDINVISAHTNLDMADGGVNDCLAKALHLEQIKKIICNDGFSLRKGRLSSEMTPNELAKYVGDILGFSPRFVDCGKKIKTVAVCGGSGANYFEQVAKSGCDAYITAECKHHIFLSAIDLGLTLMDCGHFATEDVVIKPLTELLNSSFPDIVFETYHNNDVICN